MDIVVLGCGRVGAAVANALSASHRVTVVDWKEAAFDRLSEAFGGETVLGNGIDIDVLRVAGAPEADIFCALTDGDNRNLVAAQIARQLGARRVVARVYDPVRSEAFSKLGIITYSPTIHAADRLFTMVTNNREER